MADPVATVEKIFKLGLAIKDAVDTVRHNEEECNEIRRRVLRFSAILSQLQQTGMMNDSPAMSGALEDLEDTLERALELVTACHERSTIRRLITAGDLSKQLRRVKDDILNKVMLASFTINAHTTIVLLTAQAGDQLPPKQRQDSGMVQTSSHDRHSTSDARRELDGDKTKVLEGSDALFAPLIDFSLSELKAAIRSENVIGEGAFCKVYKGVLNNGNVVSIKELKRHRLCWAQAYDQLLLASKLQHKNIVKVLGYGHEIGSSPATMWLMWLFKRKSTRVKERGYFWVEEYIRNGSLHRIAKESRIDWSSLFRIIEGVAQGIHYLHEQRVVHMDLKPDNILLDCDMNPKITDFELSRVLDDDEIIVDRIEGTFGYVAPEYATHGYTSMKNDVYAFGATLLITFSAMCRPKPPIEHPLYEWVWKAWEAGRTEELLDPSCCDRSQLLEIKRCVQILLLCVEYDRADRPTMAGVLEMLHGKEEIPIPKNPAYIDKDEEVHAWSEGSLSPK